MTYELPEYNEADWHLKLNASIEAVRQVFVPYNGGWPARPTDSADITVVWVGGTPSTPPTDHITGVDLWYVPQSSA